MTIVFSLSITRVGRIFQCPSKGAVTTTHTGEMSEVSPSLTSDLGVRALEI